MPKVTKSRQNAYLCPEKIPRKMKKWIHTIWLPAVLLVTACFPDNLSEWSAFQSSAVEVGTVSDGSSRILILNEGLFPAFSSVDLLDIGGQRYYQDLFTQANPLAPWNMGTDATEMALIYDQLWVILFSSNQIAVIDLPSFSIVEYITVESPRHMVLHDGYVYVTSYGLAIVQQDASVVGKIYKINAATRAVESQAVGLQPEGLAVLGEKLYVADSGHLNWPKSKVVSVVNLRQFTVDKILDLPLRHPNQVISRGGLLWINTFGETELPSVEAEEEAPLIVPHSLIRMGSNGSGIVVDGVVAEKMALDHRILYAYGNAAELSGGTEWHLYKVDADSEGFIDIPFAGTDLEQIKSPGSLDIDPKNGDLYISETAADGNSRLFCFDKELNLKWNIPTGARTIQVLFWQ